MDKKNTILGLLFIGLAFLFQIKFSMDEAARRAEQQAREPQPATVEETPAYPESTAQEGTPSPLTSNSNSAPAGESAAFAEPPAGSLIRQTASDVDSTNGRAEEEIVAIENEFIRVDFTTYGGAIKRIILKQYPETIDSETPYAYNHGSPIPALAISYKDAANVREWAPEYRILTQSKQSIVFAREIEPGVRMIRSYALIEASDQPDYVNGAQPYLIDHVTRVENKTPQEQEFAEIFVNVGTAPPEQADPQGFYLNFSHYDGKEAKFIKQNKFKGGGFLFSRTQPVDKIEVNREIHWAAAKNQFFTGVLTPEEPGKGILCRMVELTDAPEGSPLNKGITGSIRFDFGTIPPAEGTAPGSREIRMSYYAGPKAYPRLADLEQRQYLVMEFGWGIIGLIGKTLLTVLRGIYSFVGNYGVAIILLTLTVRGLLWPVSLRAAKSAKRMQAIAEPMKQLREKYKDDPMRMNEEVMKLYKEHQVNPVAGCIPLFLQFPILIALFYMLRTSSELRFSSFLWIQDLSAPENLFRMGLTGLPLLGDTLEYFNLLPLLFGLTMYFQFQTMPSTMDEMQKQIFKFMPIPITLVCYGFSSGLVLYWTISNCISILQQQIIKNVNDEPQKTDPGKITVVAHPQNTQNGAKGQTNLTSSSKRKQRRK